MVVAEHYDTATAAATASATAVAGKECDSGTLWRSKFGFRDSRTKKSDLKANAKIAIFH